MQTPLSLTSKRFNSIGKSPITSQNTNKHTHTFFRPHPSSGPRGINGPGFAFSSLLHERIAQPHTEKKGRAAPKGISKRNQHRTQKKTRTHTHERTHAHAHTTARDRQTMPHLNRTHTQTWTHTHTHTHTTHTHHTNLSRTTTCM